MKNAIELYNQHVALAQVDIEKILKSLYAEQKQLRGFIFEEWKTSENLFKELKDDGRIDKNDAIALTRQYIEELNKMAQALYNYNHGIDKVVQSLNKYKNAYR